MVVRLIANLAYIFSFLTLGLNFYLYEDNKTFQTIESEINQMSSFYENGVKLQYSTSNSKQLEIEKILKFVQVYQHEENLTVNENEITYSDDNTKFSALIWQENEKAYIELTLINKDPSKNTQDIKKELAILEEKENNDIRYFEYYKGKINTIDEGISELKLCSNINKPKFVSIENGYVGTASLKNGQRLSLALVRYTTGSYVVIGTPTIFATY